MPDAAGYARSKARRLAAELEASPPKELAELEALRAGDEPYEYHRGDLASKAGVCGRVRLVRDCASRLQACGRVHLLQRRIGEGDTQYLAVGRTPRG